MKKIITIITLMIFFTFSVWAQTPTKKCDWSKYGINYSILKCINYTFEFGYKDTCISYLTYVKNCKTNKVDTTIEGRILKYTFKDTGRYWVKTIFKNKCVNCDTFMYKKINVTCKDNVGLNQIKNTYVKSKTNPSDETLEFVYEGEIVPVTVYDYLGKIVYIGNSTQNIINTELWSESYYTLQIGKYIGRFYIQHGK